MFYEIAYTLILVSMAATAFYMDKRHNDYEDDLEKKNDRLRREVFNMMEENLDIQEVMKRKEYSYKVQIALLERENKKLRKDIENLEKELTDRK